MILIDFSQFARASMIGADITTGQHKNLMKHVIMTSIANVNVKFRDRFGQLIICCDGYKYWRKQIFSGYKANRAKAREDSGVDEDLFREIKNELMNELGDNTPWYVVQHPELEADDMIAAFINQNRDEPSLIVSSDGDFKQLHAYKGIKQWCPRKKTQVTCDDPHFYLFRHIIKGDSGDGIPNVFSPDNALIEGRRQTPVREANIQKAYEDPFFFSEWIEGNQETKERYNMNCRLIDLVHPEEYPLRLAQETFTEQQQRQKENYRGSTQLMNYLAENRMERLLDRLGDFSTTTQGALI